MDNIFMCQKCRHLFDEELVLPKVLRCGHTFCLLCVTEGMDVCYYCDSPVIEDYDEMPTNEAVLDLVRLEKSLEHTRARIYDQVHKMKVKLKFKQNVFFERKQELASKINLVCNALTHLETLEEANEKYSNETLRKLESSFQLKTDEELMFWRIRSNISVSPLKCLSITTYLQKIYDFLINDKRTFSVQNVGPNILYGKISVIDDWICFHTLACGEAPVMDQSIWFQDLMQCLGKENFRVFVTFPKGLNRTTEKVVIEMMNSRLAPTFVRLCSGESGTSYKGIAFNAENYNYFYYRGWEKPLSEEDDENVNVVEDQIELPGYFKDSKIEFTFNKNDTIVKMCPNGFFKLIKCFGETMSHNVVGKVVSPTDVDSLVANMSSNPTIVDCGILIQI